MRRRIALFGGREKPTPLKFLTHNQADLVAWVA